MNKLEFTHLYQKHYPLLYKYLYRLSRNEDTAKDICQEVFLKLYTETSEGKNIEFVKSWLFKCASNNFFNQIKRAQIITFESHSPLSEASEIKNPEEQYIKQEKLRNLEQALSKISSAEKQLIYLYQEEFTYAEISDITGIKLTSVGKTLSRTIQKVSIHLHKTKCYELL